MIELSMLRRIWLAGALAFAGVLAWAFLGYPGL
jgi:hypothetical protein